MTLRPGASIRKYFGVDGPQKRRSGTPAGPSCDSADDRLDGRRRRGPLDRVLRRPDPEQWSQDELLALHEAVALLWPSSPVSVSSLRTAIVSGQLAHVRIAGRIYTTRAALAAMSDCRRSAFAFGAGHPEDVDWDAHLATLLPGRGDGAG